ncbi:MAG: hypothetical protein LBI36_05370 [Oscillospiraceae bacterium]|nr:hypothetical protein [Oscillospiraceae bacterium]
MSELVALKICEALKVSPKEALGLWYSSQTYRKFVSPRFNIAREGGMAMVERLAIEWDSRPLYAIIKDL